MKGKRYTTEDKIRILREGDRGKSILEIFVSDATGRHCIFCVRNDLPEKGVRGVTMSLRRSQLKL